eukprot:14201775-Ditylum_brightwellii.AAC.1
MREHQMEMYHLEMECMEKLHDQHKDEQYFWHNELMIIPMMSGRGKQMSDLQTSVTNNPIITPVDYKKHQSKIPGNT